MRGSKERTDSKVLLVCILCFLRVGEMFMYLFVKEKSQRKETEERRQKELLRKLGPEGGRRSRLQCMGEDCSKQKGPRWLTKGSFMSLTITCTSNHAHLLGLLCCHGTKIFLKEKDGRDFYYQNSFAENSSNAFDVFSGITHKAFPPAVTRRAVSLERPQKQSGC